MAPKDGKALMMFTLAPGKSLQEAANAVVQQNNLQVLRSDNVTVNGLRALAMVADVKQDPQQQQQAAPVRTLTYLIQYGETIYLMLGATSAADYQVYSTYFLNSMQGFRPLTDVAMINRKPERVRIKTINTNSTLEQVLRTYKVPDKRFEEHAILNGMMLSDRIAPGTMIKVVER
jgi:predicted Zn-dependent protease